MVYLQDPTCRDYTPLYSRSKLKRVRTAIPQLVRLAEPKSLEVTLLEYFLGWFQHEEFLRGIKWELTLLRGFPLG